MSTTLTDVSAAVMDLLKSQVTTTIDDAVPDGTGQTELNPGDEAVVFVHVANAAAPDGVRLLNLRLHLEVKAFKGGDPDPATDPSADADAKKVALLLAPSEGDVQCTDNNGHDVLPGEASASGELIIKYVKGGSSDRSVLGAGGFLTQPVRLDCKEHGKVHVTCHVHADIDQSSLSPNPKSKNGVGLMSVAF